MKIKLLLATTIIGITLVSCTTSNLEDGFSNGKKEISEAIDNLKNEVIEIKEWIETKTQQLQDAANSVSGAVDAINKAKEDIGSVVKENNIGEEET